MTAAAPTTRTRGPGRYLALARGELRILLRNKVAAFYAVVFAPLLVILFASFPQVEIIAESLGGSLTTYLVSGVVVFGLSVAVYFNLTTAVVARREKLVLKRLVAGESTRAEVLAAIATPNVAIFLLQVVAVLAVGIVLFGAPAFTNPVLAVLAVVLGTPIAVMLAYVTGAYTRTVESAQLTTMPGMMIGMLLSGAILPVAILPDAVVRIMEFTPIYPIVQLVNLGLAGTDGTGGMLDLPGTFGAAAVPVLVLVAWNVIMYVALRRTMRWEPRR